jgi:hypothetical protein
MGWFLGLIVVTIALWVLFALVGAVLQVILAIIRKPDA